MKLFTCRCGNRLFFENDHCVGCGAELGFDPASMHMKVLEPLGDGRLRSDDGGLFHHCANRGRGVCNWLIPDGDDRTFCIACRLNELIPALTEPKNLALWTRVEQAKRRLFYTLLSLDLPVEGAAALPALKFRFLEDRRSNPDVFEEFVTTGHIQGTITINLAEADDVERTRARERMQERYRTLLGHFRHEIAHFYFDYLLPDDASRSEFRGLFGDERQDYQAALERHYSQGAPAHWDSRYVSVYAAAHPHEDWAETFAHFLHIVDALETAREMGLTTPDVQQADWLTRWMGLAVTLNELNRSLGAEDPYPFVFTETVIAKLEFIRQRVGATTRSGAPGAWGAPRTPA